MLSRSISGSWITVNRQCNFRCLWCYAEGTDYKLGNDMKLDLAKNLTQMLREAGAKQVIIIGGEPTLWPHLVDYNKFCKSIGIITIMPTNGLRFSDDSFFEQYSCCPNDSIGISLKAGNAHQLKEITRCDKFQELKKGVCRVLQNFNSTVSLTYNTFYEDNLLELVQFAVDCGAKGVKIDFCSTVFERGIAKSDYMIPPKKLVSNIMRDYEGMLKITDNIIFEMSIPFCLWPNEFIKKLVKEGRIMSVCQLIKRNSVIFDTDGKLIVCNALFDYPLGKYKVNFYNSQSLLDFLNSDTNLNYYKIFSRYPSLKCRDCEWYDSCGGGCPLRWAIYSPNDIIS